MACSLYNNMWQHHLMSHEPYRTHSPLFLHILCRMCSCYMNKTYLLYCMSMKLCIVKFTELLSVTSDYSNSLGRILLLFFLASVKCNKYVWEEGCKNYLKSRKRHFYCLLCTWRVNYAFMHVNDIFMNKLLLNTNKDYRIWGSHSWD
jgi:hypothetical protein